MVGGKDLDTLVLESGRIHSLPNSMYYIPDFISESEEIYLLQKVNASPWVQLSKRRLQPVPSALLANNTLLAAPLPTWLQDPITFRFRELGIFTNSKHGASNHVLVNEYQPGQGIMPHEDGAAYSPIVATVSLGASIILDVTEKRTEDDAVPLKGWRILQEPRSLLVTTDDAYTQTLHGIAEANVDEHLNEECIANWNLLGDQDVFDKGRNVRTTRISLTYRDVLKVSRAFGSLLGRR